MERETCKYHADGTERKPETEPDSGFEKSENGRSGALTEIERQHHQRGGQQGVVRIVLAGEIEHAGNHRTETETAESHAYAGDKPAAEWQDCQQAHG